MIGRLVFPATIVVSLALHGTLFVHFNSKTQASSAAIATPAPQVTRVVFNQPVTTLPDIPTPPKKEHVEAPKPKPSPRPLPKPTPKPAAKIAKPMPPPEPEPIEVVEKIEDTPVDIEPMPEQTPPPAAAMASAKEIIKTEALQPLVSRGMEEDEKQRYKSQLMAHIEAHKYYPSAARKRAIEGDVLVSFVLSPEGEVKDIAVKGGPRMLRKAAKKAVQAALPFPTPDKKLDEAMPMTYKMAFAIQ